MKKIIICLAALCLLFSGCKKCKGRETMNLPALDWELYHDVATLYPYACYYNDTNFCNQYVKLTGWFVAGSGNINKFSLLSDNKQFRIDIERHFDVKQMRQLIDSFDITQKCYIIGKLKCGEFDKHQPCCCPEYYPVLVVDDIKNISFGKEVEYEE